MSPSLRLQVIVAALAGLAVLLGSLTALDVLLPAWLGALWWSLLLTTTLVAGADALQVRRLPAPAVERELPGKLPVGRWSEVRLAVVPAGATPVRILVFDHLPAGMTSDQLPFHLPLVPGQRSLCSYRLQPQRRGHFAFSRCELHLPSPLGLWWSRRLLPLASETRVFPDFTRLHGTRLRAVDNWLSQLGVRQRPRRGLGQDFHQLRDFREGDTLRQIDWKATARKRGPVVREYQDERDQRIILLLDCGRRMRSQDDSLSHFDHALEACLLLSHVALRQGDAVGLGTFAGTEPRFLAPGKGPGQLNALLSALYDVESTRRPADFTAAVRDLLAQESRRALVLLITNLRDEDDEALPAALRQLARRHRVLLVSLREEILDRLAEHRVERFEHALDYCGAREYLSARERLHRQMEAGGIAVLDARPRELGPQLIERYLAMKKAGTL